jgi:hypothetical protein
LAALRIAPHRRWPIDRTIARLVESVPLAAMSYYAGDRLTGRRLSWSLALTYATYRPRQAWRVLHRLPASLRADA